MVMALGSTSKPMMRRVRPHSYFSILCGIPSKSKRRRAAYAIWLIEA